MKDDNNIKIDRDNKTQEKIIIPYKVENQKMIVCEMCGYANPEYTAICKNCSNYIERR